MQVETESGHFLTSNVSIVPEKWANFGKGVQRLQPIFSRWSERTAYIPEMGIRGNSLYLDDGEQGKRSNLGDECRENCLWVAGILEDNFKSRRCWTISCWRKDCQNLIVFRVRNGFIIFHSDIFSKAQWTGNARCEFSESDHPLSRCQHFLFAHS